MRHSIHTQHTKFSHRLPSLSVSSGDLLVAINKLLNESHGVNGAPASNNVIPRKYIYPFMRFTHTSWQCLRSIEFFLLYVISYTQDLFDTIHSLSLHCRLPVNYTIYDDTIPSILYQYRPSPCSNHTSQPSTSTKNIFFVLLVTCCHLESLIICNAQPSGHLGHFETIGTAAHTPGYKEQQCLDWSVYSFVPFPLTSFWRHHHCYFQHFSLFVCKLIDLIHNLHFGS